MKVTIRDVAREAGVSIQTVSNVLNRRGGLRVETRRRVREVAQRLGYRPSAAARLLRSGRSRTIGLLIPNVANPYFAEIVRGAEDAARSHGYSVIIGNTDAELGRIEQILNLFREHWVAGAVTSIGRIDPAQIAVFDEFAEEIPLVQIGRLDPSDVISRVVVDDQRGGYVATSHLLSLGRRSIITVTGPLDTYPGARRLAGYRAALTEWGVPFDPANIIEGDFSFQSGHLGVGTLLDRGARPDGIFAANDLTAIGAITRLRERGLRVPEDVAVIGYDDTDIARYYNPSLSTIAQPKHRLGYRGVELLIERLASAEQDPGAQLPAASMEVLDCRLLARQSSIGRAIEIDYGSIISDPSGLIAETEAGLRPPRG